MVQERWTLTIYGDNGVGKTALTWRFITNYFGSYFSRGAMADPTVDEIPRKHLIIDNNVCLVDVIDPPGETLSRLKVGDRWIRECPGFLLVYSVTSRASFASAEAYWKALCRIKGENAPLLCMLLGNKCDDGVGRAVSQKEGEALAQRLGCPFLEVSAKTGLNVERVFVDMVHLLRDPEKGVPDRNVVRMRNEKEKKKKKKCIIL